MKYGVIVNYNTMSLKSRTAPSGYRKEQMNSRFDQLTKGLLSLAVILMFTVALVAGQARANLPADATAAANFGGTTRIGIILDTESLQKIDASLHIVEKILALPIDIEFSINELRIRTGNAAAGGPDDASVQ